MIGGRPASGAILATLVACTFPLATGAEDAPSYSDRLRLPTRGDAMRHPISVHADAATGEIFVCDQFENRILIFDEQGLFRFEISGGALFNSPRDVAVDAEGHILLLANTDRGPGLLWLDFDGRFESHATPKIQQGDDEYRVFSSVAYAAANDRMYVIDAEAKRMIIAERDGAVVRYVDLAEGLSEKDRLEQVLGHVDVYGETVFVSTPSEGQVLRYDLAGTALSRVGLSGTAGCQTAFPVAAALDARGRVIVLDKQRALMTIWEPEGNRCLAEFGVFGTNPGALYQPSDLALDRSGRIYASQVYDGRIQVWELGAAGRSSPLDDPR